MATLLLLLSSMLPPSPAPVHPSPPVCGADDDCDGDGWTPNDGDCDDGAPWNYPGGVEVCDGADNDCDDLVDEGTRIQWYLPIKGQETCRIVGQWDRPSGGAVFRCQQPDGYVPACPRI